MINSGKPDILRFFIFTISPGERDFEESRLISITVPDVLPFPIWTSGPQRLSDLDHRDDIF